MTFANISVDAAVTVVVRPDCSTEATDCSTDGCALEHPKSADQRARACADSSTRNTGLDGCSGNARAVGSSSGLILAGLALIILVLIDVAVRATITVAVCPDCTQVIWRSSTSSTTRQPDMGERVNSRSLRFTGDPRRWLKS